MELYWQIGKYIAEKTREEGWGKSTVQNLSDYLAAQDPDLQGFTARNLWRMKTFFETYSPYLKLTTLLSEIQCILAPTILTLMGLPVPAEMTGEVLVKRV